MAASLVSNLLALAVPLAMIQIYDRVIPNAATETLAVLALIVVLSVLMEAVLRIARSRLLQISGETFEREAYRAAIWAVLTEDPTQSSADAEGTRYTRLTAIERLRSQHVGEAATAILDVPFAVLFLSVITLLSPQIGALVFLLLAISFFVLWAGRSLMQKSLQRRQELEARRHSFVTEVLRGMETVKGLRVGDFMSRRYEKLLGRSAATSAQMARRVQYVQGLTASISTLAPVVTGIAGAFLVLEGQMTVGAMATIILLTGRIVQPVFQVVSFLASAQGKRYAEADFQKIVSLPRRVSGDRPLPRIEEITLDAVTTRADGPDAPQLRNLSLTLRTGDVLALQAVERAHSDVFMRLLAGEIALEAGQILINGQPAERYRLQDRQERLRVMTDDSRLLDGTLLENIAAFAPARHRDAAVRLSNALGLGDFVAQSPDGLATRVSAGGQGLLPQSTMRIASNVAALVTKPDVILFDHANAGLDRKSHQHLLSWLMAEAPDRMLVIATLRPPYLRMSTLLLYVSALVARARQRPLVLA